MRLEFSPCVGKIPWGRKWQPTPVFLPGESHGQKSLAGNSPWGCKELGTTGRHLLHCTYITPHLPIAPWKVWLLALILSSFFMSSAYTTDDPSNTLASHSFTSSFPTSYRFPPHCSQISSWTLSSLVTAPILKSQFQNPVTPFTTCYISSLLALIFLCHSSLTRETHKFLDPLLSHHPSTLSCFVWPFLVQLIITRSLTRLAA